MKTGDLCKVTYHAVLSDLDKGLEIEKLYKDDVVLIVDDIPDNKWNDLCGHIFMLVLTKEGRVGIVGTMYLIEI